MPQCSRHRRKKKSQKKRSPFRGVKHSCSTRKRSQFRGIKHSRSARTRTQYRGDNTPPPSRTPASPSTGSSSRDFPESLETPNRTEQDEQLALTRSFNQMHMDGQEREKRVRKILSDDSPVSARGVVTFEFKHKLFEPADIDHVITFMKAEGLKEVRILHENPTLTIYGTQNFRKDNERFQVRHEPLNPPRAGSGKTIIRLLTDTST